MFDPITLDDISTGTDINDLSKTQLKNLQRALSWMTYPVSKVDGLIGPNTRGTYGEYMADLGEPAPNLFTDLAKTHAINHIEATKNLMRSDVSDRKKTEAAIAAMCTHLGIGLRDQIAYVLATTKWETWHTFEPIREAPKKSEAWRKRNFRYYPYYGRGYVQLTWKSNYTDYYHIMREPLVAQPDLALGSEIALFVLVHGCKMGTFTGRKIEDYINASGTDFKNARRVTNGTDKWAEIKAIAEDYAEALS